MTVLLSSYVPRLIPISPQRESLKLSSPSWRYDHDFRWPMVPVSNSEPLKKSFLPPIASPGKTERPQVPH